MQLIKSNGTFPTIAKMFDQLLNDDFFPAPARGTTLWNSTLPAVNVKETEDQYELELAAPGLEKGDFNIEVDQDVLTISSEKKENKEEKEDGRFTRREFRYSSFKRSFNLPETIDSSKIGANYAEGILSVVIPKKEEAKPQPARKIEIG